LVSAVSFVVKISKCGKAVKSKKITDAKKLATFAPVYPVFCQFLPKNLHQLITTTIFYVGHPYK
jgi:hypothetical protein